MALNFPHDIIIDILTKIPVKSLLRFKSVCKSWYSLMEDAKFIKHHYDTHKNCQKYFMACSKKNPSGFYHYNMDVPKLGSSTSIVSLVESPVPINELVRFNGIRYFSSNGILLIIYIYMDERHVIHSDDKIIMWNPATKESRIIPPHSNRTEIMNGGFYEFCYIPGIDDYKTEIMNGGFYEFCYIPGIDDYKIFRVGLIYANGNMEIDIFSTKSNMWNPISFPPNYYFGRIVMADGVVYMTARRKDLSYKTMVRLCLEKEQFQEKLLLPFTTVWPQPEPDLYSVGGKLCLSTKLVDDHHDNIHEYSLYMMNTNSWSKILTVPLPDYICGRPWSFMKDGEMLFKSNSGFMAYNSTTQEFELVNVSGIEEGLCFNKVVTYVETLSSIS